MATDYRTCVKYDIIEDHALGRKGSIHYSYLVINVLYSVFLVITQGRRKVLITGQAKINYL